ncbi:hypothetical protein [uncultured Parabacteroides sp.]|uniref:hypothetical protein n=1 Tax=uncultured Parabacteroides sp. TaxID=512312 RepID=UPI002633E501|nr:hypothetical protein [uncultured Parabacteroides sp.]
MTIKEQLSQIANMLLLNGTLTECPGLVHGKIGQAIFFFYYAHYTGNMLFADYAIDLIGEMQNQIHINSPADYERGIAGIGVGIDYLIRQKFLLVEEDICEDFDPRMYRAVMYDPWQGFGLYDGLIGHGRYWISRLRYQEPIISAQECLGHILNLLEENFESISYDEQTDVYGFLFDLKQIPGYENCSRLLEKCRNWEHKKAFSRLKDSVVSQQTYKIQSDYYFKEEKSIEANLDPDKNLDLDMEKPPAAMGLFDGYAGEGLLRMDVLGKTDGSWALLL